MAYGDIVGLVDSWQFVNSNHSTPCHVAGNIYAIAYRAWVGGNLTVITVAIANNGIITKAAIATLDLGYAPQGLPTIVKIAPNVFAIAGGFPFRARFDTISIADNGTIGGIIATRIINPASLSWFVRENPLTNVAGDVWAIVVERMDGANSMTVATISITPLGAIGAAFIDVQTFASPTNIIPTKVRVKNNLYAIIRCANALPDVNDIKTFTISDAGAISAEIAGFVLDTLGFTKGQLVNVAGNVWAAFYAIEPIPMQGKIKTFTINDDGSMGAIIDTFIFDAAIAAWNSTPVRRTGDGIFTVIYAKIAASSIIIKSIAISDAGVIGPVTSTLAGPTIGAYPTFNLRIPNTDMYVLTGRNTDAIPNLSWLGTYEIETIPELPTVSTDPATAIGATSATLNGTLDSDGGEACDVRFQWGETIAYGNDTAWQGGKVTSDTFLQAILGLTPGQEYHFRAQARNGAGTADGADRTFTALIAVPTVTTNPATVIGTTSATLNGILADDGGEACDCGFEWGETIAYEHGATPTDSKTTGQTFSQVIIGLVPNTTYHFRAFATNAAGTAYGIDRVFTTNVLPPAVVIPTVTTDPASAISNISATLNGILDDDGGEACECGFEWGTDITYGVTTPAQSKVTGQSFSQAIGGLFPGTGYHFRAFATNSAGTGHGADRSFSTAVPANRAYALSREEL